MGEINKNLPIIPTILTVLLRGLVSAFAVAPTGKKFTTWGRLKQVDR